MILARMGSHIRSAACIIDVTGAERALLVVHGAVRRDMIAVVDTSDQTGSHIA